MTHYSRTGHNIVSLPQLPPYPLSMLYPGPSCTGSPPWQSDRFRRIGVKHAAPVVEVVRKSRNTSTGTSLLCFFSVRTSSEVNLKGQLQTDEKDTIASQKDELGGGRLESNLISSTRPLAPECSANRLLTTKKETYIRDQNFNKGCGILQVQFLTLQIRQLFL